ncbi:alpha/beta fold hydrolase [Asticcacaulis sp. AC402]|uniref:alpha/beta fold hydrolase n=1 Tax=Asticcacaulis sp. AC402 TaxID=1282361 RepID=UPI0003C401D6|nr:alpha/beta hydrolase [Asticcacaulis sp. AC402]ESQ74435.1 hypothetical protein ABAC402_14045 [Asticcacaulis sp. AC402]
MSVPLVILLPGTDGTGVFFDALVAAVSPHAEVRVLAYPQSGPQTYDHLGNLLLPHMPTDHDYILVGESFGGPLAIWLAAHAPRRPVKLVLGATFAASPFGRLGRWVLPLLWIGEHLPLWTWQIDLVLFNGRNRAIAHHIHQTVLPIPRRTLIARARTVLACDQRALIDRLTMPVLCLNAARDRMIPPWLPRHFGGRPHVRVVNLDLPHMIFQSDAQGIVQDPLLPFLKD